MHPKKAISIILCLCGTSILLILGGILLIALWKEFYEYIIHNNLILASNSAAYNIWIKNPVPLALKLYVFNWTNPEQIYNHTEKPKFQQLGPYYFHETKEKSSVVWNNNYTVTYNNLKKWYFDQSLSNGSLTDTMTSVNPVALSAAYTARHWNYFVKKGLSVTLHTMIDSIATSHTVGQVLFEGYDDPMLKAASKFSYLHSSIPMMDKFGWFYGRNGSEEYEGTFNADTGENGQIGQLYNWRYSQRTPYPDACGSLTNTSSGDFFPRNLNKDSIIKLFTPDMCRYVELEFEKEVVINGLLGYKYSAGDRFLDNGTKVKENKCFCDGDCMPYGLLNISSCRYGSPAFVSLPHFYKADPYYVNNVEGLAPEEQKNDFYMVFEPNTAIPLEVAARLQLNLQLQPVSALRLYENLPVVYIPVVWFEQIVTLPDSLTFNIKLLVNFKMICYAISSIAIAIGVLIQICLCYKVCTINLFGKKKPKTTKSEKSIPQENIPLKISNTS